MRGVSFLLILGLLSGWGVAEFLNNRPFPTYSLESMPDTDFTCRDKILGGYYADAQTQCQMFHICVKVSGVGVQDFRFLCPNGTAFDQDHQICAEWDDVDCDATTLYYASDNFDLYRLGSGFESKAVKYGEEEEPFSLQRAETGDIRLNREHQAQRVNQKKEFNLPTKPSKVDNSERDIFKTSSSSNFFNNRNGGKEVDDEEDDGNYNVNQNRDSVGKKKLLRKQQRRPEQNLNQDNNQQTRPQQPQRVQQPQRTQQPESQRVQQQPQKVQQQEPQRVHHQQPQRVQQQEAPRIHQQPQKVQQQEPQPQRIQQQQPQRVQQSQELQKVQQNQEFLKVPQQQPQRQTDILKEPRQQQNNNQTPRPNRPTNFINNFAGSNPTTPRATETTINNEQYSTAINNFRNRNGNRRPVNNRQYNEADSFRQSTLSTPAPFKQTQFHKATTYDDGQYRPTTARPKLNGETENYPPPFNKQNFQTTPQKPSPFKTQQQTAFSQQNKAKPDPYPTTPIVKNSGFDSNYDVPKVKPTIKQALPQKQNDYPTTFAPKSHKAFVSSQKQTDNFVPTTFAPRINFGFKQTTPQNNQNTQEYQQNTQQSFNQNSNQNNQQSNQNPEQNVNTQYNHPGHIRPFVNQFSQKQNQQFPETQPSTPKTTPFTHYTPTVPKVTSTTPVSRSNRFDETQYDDSSYYPRYDSYDNSPSYRDDEFLKAEHSQNIASSRNELYKNARKAAAAAVAVTTTTQRPYYSESPRPFSPISNPSRVTDRPKTTKQVYEKKQQPQEVAKEEKKQTKPQKVEKNVSYDYAYYDTNVGSDPDYEIDTDFKKTTPQ